MSIKTTQFLFHSGIKGICRFLCFVALYLLSVSGFAQIEQKPELETGPPAGPTPPRPAPVTPPAPRPPVATPAPDTIRPKIVTPPVSKAETYEDTKPSILTKLFVGGGFDLGFSSSSYYGVNYSVFNIGASPLLGYRINKILAVGPGLVYNYYSFNGNNFSEYGAKAFTQVIVYKQFFLHGEHVVLSSQNFKRDQAGNLNKTDRYQVQSTLAGGGYRQMASDRFGFDLYVLFNLSNSSGISNSGPVIRGGFIYNLSK